MIFPISLPTLACITLLFVRSIESQHLARCGSLITYQQLSGLLGTAPRCFRDGCGSDSAPSWKASFCADDISCCSNNVNISSIFSACWPQSPAPLSGQSLTMKPSWISATGVGMILPAGLQAGRYLTLLHLRISASELAFLHQRETLYL